MTDRDGQYCYHYPHPAVTVDVAAFCMDRDRLKLLLIQRGREPFTGRWALPGGFIDIDEELEDAARREFGEETGLAANRLRQMHAFGTVGRDPRERTVSVVYLTYLSEAAVPNAGDDAAEAAWFVEDALPALAFDHAEIIAMAFERARADHGIDVQGWTP